MLLFNSLQHYSHAQSLKEGHRGGRFVEKPTQCLLADKREALIDHIENNKKTLKQRGIALNVRSYQTVKFQFPLRAANKLQYHNYYGISNYVDHDKSFSGSNNDMVEDYNCGKRSYDTSSGYNHRGTDYFPFPFKWYLMDNDLVEVVAAASGIITAKVDGNYDKNCAFSNAPWNVVTLQHDDGSSSWYGHLKSGSLTSKLVGQRVETGEYLGIIGSSGSSTGPHLHFEVYDADFKLLDPYLGTCNAIDSSKWANQHEYYDSKINLIQTQSAPPDFSDCPPSPPKPATINKKDQFIAGERVYFSSYFTDQRNGLPVQHTIFRSDGVLYDSWDNELNNPHYDWSYWWKWYTIPEGQPEGEWTYQVIFNGDTANHQFIFGMPSSSLSDILASEISIFPNPVTDQLSISWESQWRPSPNRLKVLLYDFCGKQN